MVLTFDIDTLLISIFDNIVSNQEIRHFVPLWPYIFQSASFLKFMTVDLFEGDIIRNSLSHISLKLVEVENFTFH